MEKKFQVFISSTYDDLKSERKAVEETIIRSGDFPVGMEAFPAADEEQFEFIKSVINSCDYYVLIIAGRYGSISKDGNSYTEKEYDYAVERGIPVLILLRDHRESLPANLVELQPEGKARLEDFITRVTAGRLRKAWETVDGLKLAVREALDYAKATKPRPGWVRGDRMASTEVLEQLAAVQKENIALQHKLSLDQELKPLGISIEDLEAKIEIYGTYKYRFSEGYAYEDAEWGSKTTFVDVFRTQSPNIAEPLNVETLSYYIAKYYSGYPINRGQVSSLGTSRETMNQLRVQFEALQLIDVYQATTIAKTVGSFWRLTEKGKSLMHNLNVKKIDD